MEESRAAEERTIGKLGFFIKQNSKRVERGRVFYGEYLTIHLLEEERK